MIEEITVLGLLKNLKMVKVNGQKIEKYLPFSTFMYDGQR